VLGDPEKRKKYDELGANWRMYEQAGAGAGSPFGGQWNVNVGGGQGGFRTMTQEEMADLFGESNPFSDFFTTFFGGAAASAVRACAREARRPVARAATRARDRTVARGGLQRRHAPVVVQAREQTRTVDVRIPAASDDGSRVRVSGEGEQAPAVEARAICICGFTSCRIPSSSARVATCT
jgi:DnaJ-class molecular chaperone